MRTLQAGLLTSISNELALFSPKLKEELNKERDLLESRIQNNDETVLDDYQPDMRDFITELIEEENKDMIDELVLQFCEKVEHEVSARDQDMQREREREWTQIQDEILQSQNMRSRNIIMEIIDTTKMFEDNIRKLNSPSLQAR